MVCPRGLTIIKRSRGKCVMFLGENLYFDKSAIIAFVQTNANRAKPNPLNDRKREQIGFIAEMFSLFLLVE